MENIEVEYLPFWRRYLEQIEGADLSDQDLGMLTRAMMNYQFRGEEPQGLSTSVKIFWSFVRSDLDHARQRYENSVINGRKRGRKNQVKPMQTQNNLNEGISITESISESKSESITESLSEKESGSSASLAEADLCLSKKTYGEYGWIRLSDREYQLLLELMGGDELQQCITYIDESAQSTGNRNHWLDWYAVLRRCYQRRWHHASCYGKPEIPKGASGHLGQAELEAIQSVLAT